MVTHKCADCGYLGVRHIDRQELICPGLEQRRTGEPPVSMSAGLNQPPDITETMPVCAVGAYRITEEAESKVFPIGLGRPPDQMGPAAKVMQKERDCEQFTPWIPGLSPKEHIDMNLLTQNQCYQERRERRSTLINVLLLATAILAAVAAWWSATHPTVITIPSSPSASAPAKSATP